MALVDYDSDQSESSGHNDALPGTIRSPALTAGRKRKHGGPIKIQVDIGTLQPVVKDKVSSLTESKDVQTSFASSLPAPRKTAALLTLQRKTDTKREEKKKVHLFPTNSLHSRNDTMTAEASKYTPLLVTQETGQIDDGAASKDTYAENEKSILTSNAREESYPAAPVYTEIPRKRRRDDPPDLDSIPVVDADARYQANIEYNQSAENEEAAPVRFIGTGKHQLSTLLGAVMSQKDALESNFAKQKQMMRESKARYGR